MTDFQRGAGRIKTCTKYGDFMGFHRDFIRISNGFHRDMYVYIYMVPSQNCVWNVPRCSGRMERRGFVTGLVPDLWSVMKYRLYINK